MKFTSFEAMDAHRTRVTNIDNFVQDGFEKVCDVRGNTALWHYENIREDLLFSDHDSWVYMIVLNKMIVKVGETGNPLGLKAYYGDRVDTLLGTKSRLGRLRNGTNTDRYIRQQLDEDLQSGHSVSIWAKKCPIKFLDLTIAGKQKRVKNTIHKDLEQAIFDYFLYEIGQLPVLNKAKK